MFRLFAVFLSQPISCLSLCSFFFCQIVFHLVDSFCRCFLVILFPVFFWILLPCFLSIWLLLLRISLPAYLSSCLCSANHSLRVYFCCSVQLLALTCVSGDSDSSRFLKTEGNLVLNDLLGYKRNISRKSWLTSHCKIHFPPSGSCLPNPLHNPGFPSHVCKSFNPLRDDLLTLNSRTICACPYHLSACTMSTSAVGSHLEVSDPRKMNIFFGFTNIVLSRFLPHFFWGWNIMIR